MSVRMALAKLCACTAGGAILGGGAVHVAENPPQRPALVHHSKVAAAPRVAVRTVKRVRRVVRTACVVRQPGRTIVTRTFAYPPAPMAPPPPIEVVSGGGAPPPIIVGGSGGGFFGGGFFSGGFFGGGSTGNVFFTASTSSGGATSCGGGAPPFSA